MKIKNFLEKSTIAGLYSSGAALTLYLEKALAGTKLSYTEALIISALFFESEKEFIGPGRLSNILGIKKARVSQSITKLCKMGYIRREISSEDSRKFKISLEPTGSKKAVQMIKLFNTLDEKIEKNIGTTKSLNLNRDLMKITLALKETN